jgi:Do/DeqQ family serine protease
MIIGMARGKKRANNALWMVFFGSALLGLGCVSGLVRQPPLTSAQPTPKVVPESRQQLERSFAPVVKNVAPAVVNIYAKSVMRQPSSGSFFDDSFFRHFFGGRMPHLEGRKRLRNTLGSGVVVRADGLVVTNHHVIKGAQEIRVVLWDQREFEAKVVVSDERTDLAIIRLELGEEKLSALAFRDSNTLEVGDLVLAIGNPFGVGQTVTSGIVSGLARTGIMANDHGSFIQTDAAINPGNSGGALVSMDGKLVGVNSAIFSPQGGSVGIGFAIPANMVKRVVDHAAQGGEWVRPWLGAVGNAIPGKERVLMGLEGPFGVLINEVVADGPADRAGLKAGDVLVAVDGVGIKSFQALRFHLETRLLGGTSTMAVWRHGKEFEVEFPLEALPEKPPRRLTLLQGRHPLSGVTVANLSPALADELGLDDLMARGVIVTQVEPRSYANRVRLSRGDIFHEVNSRPIISVIQLQEILARERSPWRLSIRRDQEILTVFIRD